MSVSNVLFRELDPVEQEQFREWARENYKPGEDINPCWHPVVQDECSKIELAALAREAFDIQNACNLTGVVHSFSRACTRLRRCLPGEGTRTFNAHPVVRAYVDKLLSLSGGEADAMVYQCLQDIIDSDETAPTHHA